MQDFTDNMLGELQNKVKPVPNIQSKHNIFPSKVAVPDVALIGLSEKSRIHLVKLEVDCETDDTLIAKRRKLNTL